MYTTEIDIDENIKVYEISRKPMVDIKHYDRQLHTYPPKVEEKPIAQLFSKLTPEEIKEVVLNPSSMKSNSTILKATLARIVLVMGLFRAYTHLISPCRDGDTIDKAIGVLCTAIRLDTKGNLTRPHNLIGYANPKYLMISSICAPTTIAYIGDSLRHLDLRTSDSRAILRSVGLSTRAMVARAFEIAEWTLRKEDMVNLVNILDRPKREIIITQPASHDYYDTTYHSTMRTLNHLLELVTHENTQSRCRCFILSLYLHKYSQWAMYPKFKGPDGERFVIHKHRLMRSMVARVGTEGIPWNVHPSVFFLPDAIEEGRFASLLAGVRVDKYRLDRDLLLPGVSELVTSDELVEEGITMKHCVGGSGYIEGLSDPNSFVLRVGVSSRPSDRMTVQLVKRDNGQLHVVQRYGVSNSTVDEDHPAWDLYVRQLTALSARDVELYPAETMGAYAPVTRRARTDLKHTLLGIKDYYHST